MANGKSATARKINEKPPQDMVRGKADQVPDYIKQGSRGNENITSEDLIIPRIELVQMLSPCLKKNDAAYIAGAEPGMLYNSVTRELYGHNTVVVPVFYKKQFLLWKERDAGGGFGGAYNSPQEANENAKGREKPGDWEPVETAQQLVLVVNEDGSTEEAVVSMSRTKLKVSRQWNSLIRMNGNDRFSREYTLFSVDEVNSVKQDYKNFAILAKGFVSRDVYAKAEALYNALSTGVRKMKIDENFEGQDTAGAAAGPKEY